MEPTRALHFASTYVGDIGESRSEGTLRSLPRPRPEASRARRGPGRGAPEQAVVSRPRDAAGARARQTPAPKSLRVKQARGAGGASPPGGSTRIDAGGRGIRYVLQGTQDVCRESPAGPGEPGQRSCGPAGRQAEPRRCSARRRRPPGPSNDPSGATSRPPRCPSGQGRRRAKAQRRPLARSPAAAVHGDTLRRWRSEGGVAGSATSTWRWSETSASRDIHPCGDEMDWTVEASLTRNLDCVGQAGGRAGRGWTRLGRRTRSWAAWATTSAASSRGRSSRATGSTCPDCSSIPRVPAAA
jgi:hypothetical protein